MSNERPLQGRVALVTGSSRGIGLAIARRLVDDGATVCLTARGDATLQAAVEDFPAGTAIGVSGRSDDPSHRAEVLDRVALEWGRLDILVNNTGINPHYGRILDLPLDSARKILDVNVVATLSWVQQAIGHAALGFRDRGSIVNVGSVTARTPSPGIGMYGISKAAIEQLTRTLAVELSPGVRVNAVAPAVIKTSFSRALYAHDEEGTAAQYPLGRLGTPEDVAAAVAFLVSDDAAWITGEILTLDGGLMAGGGRA